MSDEAKKTNEENTESVAVENTAEATVSEKKEEKKDVKPVKKIKNTLEAVEKEILAAQNNIGKFPKFGVGDTVKVYVKIVEGDKQRLQPYEGLVIAFKHGGPRESFIVRRISYGVSIERVFPLHSPYLEKVELIRKGKVRRAKLYYMRGRFGRSAVVKERVK